MSKKYSVSQECVAMVTELTLRQSEILANDLECFSRHAKRCELIPFFSQNEVMLSYHIVRRLYFLAVVFVTTVAVLLIIRAIFLALQNIKIEHLFLAFIALKTYFLAVIALKITVLASKFTKICKIGGGSNPIFAMAKMCLFPFFPMGKNGKKRYMEKEGKVFISFSFHILFSHFSHGQKWGWTPQNYSILPHFSSNFSLTFFWSISFFPHIFLKTLISIIF